METSGSRVQSRRRVRSLAFFTLHGAILKQNFSLHPVYRCLGMSCHRKVDVFRPRSGPILLVYF